MSYKYSVLIEFGSEAQAKRAAELFGDHFDNKSTKQKVKLESRDTKIDWRLKEYSILIPEKKMLPDGREHDQVTSEYLGHGIIRLFKTDDRAEDTVDVEENEDSTLTVPGDDTMVSILFVPTYFTVHDLLHFYIGDEIVYNQVSNFRILKNHDKGVGFNFMVLMKFKDPCDARTFKDQFNGKSFSKMDPEKCHVVPIKEVVFRKDLFKQEELTKDNNLPYLLTDPFTNTQTTAPLKNKVELPMCPVCLERMDSETTGLITIPCQHTFHCKCLDRWKNSKCPICRYSSFRLSRDSLLKQAGESAKCATCSATKNLWVCLICGNVGCGRYNSKHAIQHYDTTSHCFAMDLKTQRVWDYAGDNYVHRLVQNEVDGKLVEVSTSINESNTAGHTFIDHARSSSSGGGDEGPSAVSKGCGDLTMAEQFLRNKEYHLEYVQVLVSQLESQREYYEGKLAEETHDGKSHLKELEDKVEKLSISMKKILEKAEKKEKEYSDTLIEDRLVIKGLQANFTHLTKQNEQLEKTNQRLLNEKTDLQDQVKDLMFYLETQEKFKDATEEEKNGSVIIKQSTAQPSANKKQKKKKKKKIKSVLST